MNTARTNVRLGVEGDAEAQRRLRETGEVGDRALREIADASRPASKGLKAVSAASQEGQAALAGYAAQAGPVGGVLTAIGPAGLVAAAGIGALVAGMRGAAGAAKEFSGIKKSADELGVSLQTLQEVRGLALLGSGGDSDAADEGLATFLERISEAKQGSGDAAETFARLGVSVTDATGSLRNGKDVMLEVSDAISRLDSGAERLELRRILFGDTDGKAFVVLDQGREAVEALIVEARELGLVLDDSIIRRAADVQREVNIASRVIDLNLKQALVELAPIMVDTAEFAARVARGINRIRDAVVALESKSLTGLKAELRDIAGQIADAKSDLASGTRISLKDGVRIDMSVSDRESHKERIANLEEERAKVDALIAARTASLEAPTLPAGKPFTPTGLLADTKVRDVAAEVAEIMRGIADTREDILASDRVLADLGAGEVVKAETNLRMAQQRLSIERAERDARRAGVADGLKGKDLEASVKAARLLAEADVDAARAAKRLGDARAAAAKHASDAQAKATREASEAKAKVAKEAAEQARADAGVLASAKRLTAQQNALAVAREEAGLIARSIADAALVTDSKSLDLLDEKLQVERERVRIRAAGNRAAAGAGEFDDAAALRETAEALEHEAVATRELMAEQVRRRRVVEGQEDAARSLAEAQADLDNARIQAAPVIAALAEAAHATSVEELETLRERVETEQDIIRIRQAGEAAARGAGEFDNPARLREIAEQRERDAIALREGNEALAERERILRGQAEADARLAQSTLTLDQARAEAAPVLGARDRVAAATSSDELKMVLDGIQEAQDAAAIVAAGRDAAASAGEFGNAEALSRNAKAMEHLRQLQRDALDLQKEKTEALRDEAKAREDMAQQAKDDHAATVRQVQEIARSVFQQARNWDSVGDAVLGVAEILDRQGVFSALFGGAFGVEGAGGGAGFSNFLGGVGSSIGQFFGGSGAAPSVSPIPTGKPARRMLGGHTTANTLYEINEAGRGELFKSNTSGNVYSLGDADRMNQSANPNFTFNILTRDPETTVATTRDSALTRGRDTRKGVGGLRGMG